MKIFVAETYDELSARLADQLLALLRGKRAPLLCVASGHTPKGLYQELVKRVANGEADVSAWSFVGLDEWLGMNASDEGSCRFHLDRDLFWPLRVPSERICFFDGRAADGAAECIRIEEFIKHHGGIDAAVVGLGMNGHVGMNEPGTPPDLHAHVAQLHPVTQQVGQKYFTEKKELTGGLTLGPADLMEARSVFLVVNGHHKAEIVQKALEGPLTQTVPASLLRRHQQLHVYLDKEAASRLQSPPHAS
jgi:glucosamine-6-phosphate isomerase